MASEASAALPASANGGPAGVGRIGPRPSSPEAGFGAGGGLNVVLIQIDSLNRHFLPCYGNDWIEAPNLTAFARRSAVFDRHYVGSLPCMPARREVWAGTEEFWWRDWGPLEPWDRPIAYQARRKGVTSQLITDHYHLFEWGSHGYHHDFHGFEFIRGHECDNWRTDEPPETPDWAGRMLERRGEGARIYLRNTQDFEGEEDFFAPRVMGAAARWLERNAAVAPFFLHVDSFDVHEPFHVPEPYRSLYTDDDYRLHNPWPRYGRVDEGPSALDAREVEWVRAQFAGKLTMVDRWFGRVVGVLERTGLMENTCVIVTTDHGHYLGEHGWMGKPAAPLYSTLTHVPLIVWHPSGAHNGRRVSAMTQTVDLHATVLELLECEPSSAPTVHSRSFAPVILGERDEHRDHAVFSYGGERIGITDGEWTLLRDHDPSLAPAWWYTHQVGQMGGRGTGWRRRSERPLEFPELEAGRYVKGVDYPVWRMAPQGRVATLGAPRPDLLFHDAADPGQERDLASSERGRLRELERVLADHARGIGAPGEQLRRLRLD